MRSDRVAGTKRGLHTDAGLVQHGIRPLFYLLMVLAIVFLAAGGADARRFIGPANKNLQEKKTAQDAPGTIL